MSVHQFLRLSLDAGRPLPTPTPSPPPLPPFIPIIPPTPNAPTATSTSGVIRTPKRRKVGPTTKGQRCRPLKRLTRARLGAQAAFEDLAEEHGRGLALH